MEQEKMERCVEMGLWPVLGDTVGSGMGLKCIPEKTAG